MNYGKILFADISNGPGCRVSLFVSGCTHHCKGCFNEATWDFEFGELYTQDTEELILSYLSEERCDGLSILGGEPMEPSNQWVIADLIRRVRENPKTKDKNIWLYTGYTYEQLTNPKAKGYKRCHDQYARTDEILSQIDVLVDGEFVEEEKDISLTYRGSRNQRIIYLLGGIPVSVITGREKAKEWEGKEHE